MLRRSARNSQSNSSNQVDIPIPSDIIPTSTPPVPEQAVINTRTRTRAASAANVSSRSPPSTEPIVPPVQAARPRGRPPRGAPATVVASSSSSSSSPPTQATRPRGRPSRDTPDAVVASSSSSSSSSSPPAQVSKPKGRQPKAKPAKKATSSLNLDDITLDSDLTSEERYKYPQTQIYQGLDEEKFKNLEKTLVRAYNIYCVNEAHCNRIMKDLDWFINPIDVPKCEEIRPTIVTYASKSQLAIFYDYWNKIQLSRKPFPFPKSDVLLCKVKSTHFMVSGRDADGNVLDGIDAGGVSRDFIKNVMDDILYEKIFKCLENDDREQKENYYLNPQFEFSQKFKDTLNFLNPEKPYEFNENTKINFFKFFGNLLSFFVINGFGIPYRLSAGILSSLIYPTLHAYDEDYYYQLFYLSYDKPALYNAYKDFIRKPDILSGLALSTDNVIPDLYGDTESKELNAENFEEYLSKLSKYRFPENMKPYYKAIADGFNKIIRKFLNKRKPPLLVLDKQISKTKITFEEVEELKNAFLANMIKEISESHDVQKSKLTDLTNYMNIILSGPFIINEKRLDDEKYLDFISRLLSFWSGWNHVKETPILKYIIKVDQSLNVDNLPISHTCFYRIDLPPYKNIEKFKDKLYTAVYNVEDGIGMTGGMKNKRKTKSRRYYSKLLNKLHKNTI